MARTEEQRAVLAAFGARVRQLRTERGISQDNFARLAWLHRTYISSIERGQRDVSLINLYRLAAALGVPPGDLVDDDGEGER